MGSDCFSSWVLHTFYFHPRQSLACDLNDLKTCLIYSCLGLRHTIDSINLTYVILPKAHTLHSMYKKSRNFVVKRRHTTSTWR